MDKLGMKLFVGVSFLCFLFISVISFSSEAENAAKDESKTINSVESCDRYGRCGVLFSDGTSGIMDYPVKGSKACPSWFKPFFVHCK